ncbi:hypothetical protein PMZ80_004462 [Knufia obscura]|uniref:Phosphoglycerate mutase-like protein n=2 Tax=Knufia TaxID=430999 RepID=A0AAN8EKK0_9EURO|nr:hypothetical protein PMZ80_004462 [Knufia obscura]KAK5951660.1 hypothetical protein OHC33_007339 [Knufia fluminis]
MAPILTCIRHAQGYHNLSPENEQKYHDPDLTKTGREQCERLRDRFPYLDGIDCIMTSPIRRTIQTALIGLEPAIEKRGLKLILVPRAQETSDKPSDTGSSVKALEKEFGDKLDERRMVEDWSSNQGKWTMDAPHIETNVVELRKFIKSLDFKHVALVAHGGFLHYFTEDWSDNPGEESGTGWVNTEFRTYEYVKGEGGHLKELAESRKRRAKGAAGGYEEGDDSVPEDQK